MTIEETTRLMTSPYYEDRFVAEYWQVRIRYRKLSALIAKMEAYDRLSEAGMTAKTCVEFVGFRPDVPKQTLIDQACVMREYMNLLEVRSAMEGIDLAGYRPKAAGGRK
jgi:hypothetical protein